MSLGPSTHVRTEASRPGRLLSARQVQDCRDKVFCKLKNELAGRKLLQFVRKGAVGLMRETHARKPRK